MPNQNANLDCATALTYLGKTVLLEQGWRQEPDSFWQCMHIVGVALPIEGICKHAYFLVVEVSNDQQHPNEVFFADIRTIRVIRHRDRHGSGNVLGRIARPNLAGSRAALPARRNSSTVPANGSTGAAHP
jgi:hypothetical protein